MRYMILWVGVIFVGLCVHQLYAFNRRKPRQKSDMILESYAFKNGEKIPVEYTCDYNATPMSPPLKWIGAPAETRSFALTCVDIDTIQGKFVHWVIYNIPANIMDLPEHVNAKEIGADEGLNGWKEIGYGAPCPPLGLHRYIFKLYALDTMLNVEGDLSYTNLLNNIHGHILKTARLMGTYVKGKRG